VNLEDTEEETKEAIFPGLSQSALLTQSEPMLEAEISNLLGSLRVRASDIKATLLRTKTQLTDDRKDPTEVIVEESLMDAKNDDVDNTALDINDILAEMPKP